MTALGDAMAAIRNVILMQERIANMQKTIDALAGNVDGLNDYVVAIDKRVVRIETLVEMSRGGGSAPRIEN